MFSTAMAHCQTPSKMIKYFSLTHEFHARLEPPVPALGCRYNVSIRTKTTRLYWFKFLSELHRCWRKHLKKKKLNSNWHTPHPDAAGQRMHNAHNLILCTNKRIYDETHAGLPVVLFSTLYGLLATWIEK